MKLRWITAIKIWHTRVDITRLGLTWQCPGGLESLKFDICSCIYVNIYRMVKLGPSGRCLSSIFQEILDY